MFSFGSGAVSWSSKKQPTVALSSTEAEYRGAAIVACEVVWLQKLFSDLGQSVDAPIVIYCDNISSILLANNLVYHARCEATFVPLPPVLQGDYARKHKCYQ